MYIESVEDLYYVSSTLLMLTWISIYTWQRQKYVKLLVELDGIVEKSKKNTSESVILEFLSASKNRFKNEYFPLKFNRKPKCGREANLSANQR